MAGLADLMRGHVIWNVNSTARGGGVAELLASLIPYSRGAGIDERWAVIEGTPEFFHVTKKLHVLLHGVAADGETLTEDDRRTYAWDGLERSRVEIIPPCIDPFAAKNRDMSELEVSKVLEQASLPNRGPMVLQVSRWDRLKDPAGVMEAFARHVAPRAGALL